jgi:hypothetical protein
MFLPIPAIIRFSSERVSVFTRSVRLCNDCEISSSVVFYYYYYYTHYGDGTFQNFVRYLSLTLHMLCCFYSSYLVYFVLFLSCASKCFSVISIPVTCWISPQNKIQRLLNVQELRTASREHRRNRLTDTVNSISRSSCFYWTCGTCCTYVLCVHWVSRQAV